MAAYSVSFTTAGAGIQFAIPRASVSWYIGQDLQMEGTVANTWFDCDVQLSSHLSSNITISAPSGAGLSPTTAYTRRVRIRPNAQYRVYETTDTSVVYNSRTPFLGWSFVAGTKTYSIIGRVDTAGNNATLLRTMGNPVA